MLGERAPRDRGETECSTVLRRIEHQRVVLSRLWKQARVTDGKFQRCRGEAVVFDRYAFGTRFGRLWIRMSLRCV